MKYYHGTSYECAMGILKKGFGGHDQDTVWNCSYEDHTYTWLQDEDESDDSARFKATDNAKITAAKYGSTHEEIVVFTLEMPDEVGDEYAMEDCSCPNMDGAYVFDNNWLNKTIANGTVTILPEVATAYVPGFRWFYLSGLSMEYLSLGDKERWFVKLAGKSDNSIYCELLDYAFGESFEPLEIPT